MSKKTVSAKVAGTWQESDAFVRADGNWQIAKSGWTKFAGSWQNTYLFNPIEKALRSNDLVGANATIRVTRIQPDGKILVGGDFTEFNRETRFRLARFNSDGTLDSSFAANFSGGVSGVIYAIELQTDGKILIGGSFTTVSGVSRTRIARLNSDGTLDSSFNSNAPTLDGDVRAIAVRPDGKIVVGGQFVTVGGVAKNRLIKLNADGTEDTSFYANIGTGPASTVHTILNYSDLIIVGGQFVTFNGLTRNRIVRLNDNGTEDVTFYTNTGTAFNGEVRTMAISQGGLILVGGIFTTFSGLTRNRLVALNSNGTDNSAFYVALQGASGAAQSGFASNVLSLLVQPSDGKIIVGGSFTTVSQTSQIRMARLNTNGSIDTAFATGITANGSAFSGDVNSIQTDSSGNLFIAGAFTAYQNIPAAGFLKLNSSLANTTPAGIAGVESPAFNTTVQDFVVQPDGKIVIVGDFTSYNGVWRQGIVRLNANFTVDTAFQTNLGSGFNGSILGIALQSDGKIILGGSFTTLNGTTRTRLVRLNSDGTVDTAFYTNLGAGFASTVNRVVLQPNGQILVGGAFTTFNSSSRLRLVRLNSDGTEDSAFYTNLGTGINGTVQAIELQPNGQILLGGSFTTINSVTRNRFARINSNGTDDAAFYTNLGTGFDSQVIAIKVQSDGKILVGGGYNTLNGIARGRLVRLNSDGTLDSAFSTNIGTGFSSRVNTLAIDSSNRILAAGAFFSLNGTSTGSLVRLNPDGSRDTTFSRYVGESNGFSGEIYSVKVLSDGKIFLVSFSSSVNGFFFGRFARLNYSNTW